MISNISAWAIRKPVPTIVLFVVVTLAGLAAFLRLPVNANPSLSFPIVTVTVSQASAAPAEMESQVTRRIEGAASGLAGVNHISSTIKDGVSTTTIEFKIGIDPDRATSDVREAVGQVRSDLPQSIQEPIVSRVDVEGGAILYYTVQAPNMSVLDASWFVEDTINRELLALPGVQKVERLGGVNREITVSLDPDRLLALGVTADQVNSALRQINVNVPSGRGEIGQREQSIRTLGSVGSLNELSGLSVSLPGNRWVQLRNIATIKDGPAEPRGFARFNGEAVVGFSVSRAKGHSDTAVAARVTKRLAEIAARTPDVAFNEVISNVEYTLESYNAAITALVEGAVLTVVVVFLFLRNWRATLIAAVAMPLSILPTFAIMDLLGFTLNGVSLLALTLVVGILVDDAIVEIENIERHIDMGKRPYLASIEAADAIGLAVVATTLTIVAVFAPVSFIGGAVGQYFRQFGVTVAVAALISLVVARLLTPLMAAYLLQPKAAGNQRAGPSWLSLWYLSVLGWTLDHRKTTFGLVAVFFAGSVFLLTQLPTGFVPTGDSNVSQVQVTLPPGTRLEETARVSDTIVRDLRARSDVANVLVTTDDVNKVTLLIKLKPRSERQLDRKSFELAALPILAKTPDIRFTFVSDSGGKEVSIYLAGNNPEELNRAAHQLETEMRAMPELANVLSNQAPLAPELLVKPRLDEAARLGVSVMSLGTVARIATLGETDSNSAQFNLDDRLVPIRVLLDKSARGDLETLRKLRVGTADGKVVPLTSVANISFGAEEGEVQRLDRKRLVAVEANLNGVVFGDAMKAVAALPALKNLPASVSHIEYGATEEMTQMFRGFALALVAGILMVMAVLVLLFRNFLQPLTILIALPLSLGGAALALLLYGAALDLSSTIGILMLMGIVCKNSILLVDYAIESQAEGMDRRAALMKAGMARARPIIMTTIAMVAGMMPAAIGVGADASFRAPMAVAVIGGLITSTLLSLMVVPVMFTTMDDLNVWLGRRLKRLTSFTEADLAAGALIAERGKAA
ncbi:hydrophobe/amphiphile efflux-1 (HAE1) family protein [Mesorhizobium loti]|uniref:Hydrophobe/amphiphile efflux-1 (HAE1) family protein n=1 Tax=Rhizobium loti TaxID=381 RepID=A0A8E3B3I5_RHILI|nr:efflux RND transporter permease subunit [Mesorhizobium loti]PWJ88561.1 hydrophobe/amphiphile efflux-1 (HAE1) family protein [Mesorhizobium loti]